MMLFLKWDVRNVNFLKLKREVRTYDFKVSKNHTSIIKNSHLKHLTSIMFRLSQSPDIRYIYLASSGYEHRCRGVQRRRIRPLVRE